ncbi:helix-turn-helix domain-containing protein [Myxococcus virescens]|uniref:DNA binding domain-containing protein, excisionase family n=1 Tax=Myxococcus virescens TaxID=83456 RepID=A0A511HPY7_9BACT|nr:hypothetical protein MVI01_74500 [Myxococcus virescens]SDD66158.1 DNA binding domain-containing protein, excisionase family [Myxococcus virescens]
MGNCDGNDESLPPRLSIVRGDEPALPAEDGLWTRDEVCAYLKMGSTWVREKTASGELPCLKLGRSVRYSPAAIKEWVEQQGRGR